MTWTLELTPDLEALALLLALIVLSQPAQRHHG